MSVDISNASFYYYFGMCLSFWSIIMELNDARFNGLHKVYSNLINSYRFVLRNLRVKTY